LLACGTWQVPLGAIFVAVASGGLVIAGYLTRPVDADPIMIWPFELILKLLARV